MSENINQFYDRINYEYGELEQVYDKNIPYFNILERKRNPASSAFDRREFYKISLITDGVGKLYYADKSIVIDKPALLFSNRMIPYAWESISEEQSGYYCLFNDRFINSSERQISLANSPLLKLDSDKLYFLDEDKLQIVRTIYGKMTEELQSDYIYKYDILRNYVHLLIHEAMKMQTVPEHQAQPTSSRHTADIFVELLERQFPIDLPNGYLQLRTPADFANQLSVHVNHLNRVMKQMTGKTTSEVIADRLVKEAYSFLKYSTHTISEIAYSLGFENPSYFSNFFRKHTGHTPVSVRIQ